MSYDLGLKCPITNEWLVLDAPHMMCGGTYCLSGESRARVNITYNYAKIYEVVLTPREFKHDYARDDGRLHGIRSIYGLTGAESIPILKEAIAKLKDDVTDRHWDATEGNAKASLLQCLALAQMRPDGVWDGD